MNHYVGLNDVDKKTWLHAWVNDDATYAPPRMGAIVDGMHRSLTCQSFKRDEPILVGIDPSVYTRNGVKTPLTSQHYCRPGILWLDARMPLLARVTFGIAMNIKLEEGWQRTTNFTKTIQVGAKWMEESERRAVIIDAAKKAKQKPPKCAFYYFNHATSRQYTFRLWR